MNTEYRNVRFITDYNGSIPSQFGVVTSCNPNGKKVSQTENTKRTEAFKSELNKNNEEFFSVIGCSPDQTHQETGYGIVTNSIDKIIELGRQWEQEAVFWIEEGRTHLISCDTETNVVIGKWDQLKIDPCGAETDQTAG